MKKHIISLALILSCSILGNSSSAVDVSTSQEFATALKDSNGDGIINFTNDLDKKLSEYGIDIAQPSLTINGNGFGVDGAGAETKSQLRNSGDLIITNVGTIDESGNVISSFHDFKSDNGGVILNSGTLSIYDSVFYNNIANMTYGGAIYSDGVINNLNAIFINNKVNTTNGFGGALFNAGVIKNINSKFINNSANTVYGSGGALYNYENKEIENIQGYFEGNYSSTSGGAISNNGYIKNIVASFVNNNARQNGGAIHNLGQIYSITNSTFTGNYVSSTLRETKGGAIYTKKDLSVVSDNGTSRFSNNYIISSGGEKEEQAIFVDSNSATLTLESINNGNIIFDDKIAGTKGYQVNVIGDSSSNVYLNNDIENATVNVDNTNLYIGSTTLANQNTETNVNSGTIHLADGVAKDYNINKLTSSSSANYTIDIDNSDKLAPTPDKIITGDGSSGVITISDINLTNDTNEFESQVLVAKDDNIQLDLSDSVKEKYNKSETEKLVTSDDMVATVKWNDKFKTYEQDKITKTTLGLSTTNTQNDSIKFTSNVSYGEKTETGTVGDTLTLVNQYSTTEDRNFNFDTSLDVYDVTSDLGTTSEGTININGVTNDGEHSTINGNKHSLFKLDNETNLNVNNVKIIGANSVVTGTNKNAIVNLNNVNISNNQAGIKTAGSINIKGNSIIENNGDGITVTSADSVITLDATDATISLRDKLTGIAGSKLKINNGIVNFERKVSALDVMMENSTANLKADNLFDGNNMTVNSVSNLNLANNTVGVMQLNNFTLKDNLNLAVDVDLANKTMDRIVASNYDLGSNFVNVNQMNLLTSTDRTVTSILFADSGLKDNVTTSISEIAYSPIWKYGVNYDKGNGNFIFTKVGGDNPTPASYNPAVMVSPVVAQVGGYLGMLDTYNNAFTNMDIRMLQPSSVRVAEKMANRYAITEPKGAEFVNTERSSGGTWVRPFTSYDSVGLKHGPKVYSTSYGSFFGGDTGIHELGNGFDGVFSAHISYLGSHQSFNGNSIYQNGGNIGLTGTLYKGNFFTGLSAVTGASVADASTMYGSETFPVFTTGVASKTGYNVEFKDGRFILQPSLLLSYTYVNTFNYTNAADVKIAGDGLHAVQINPNVKFIANTKNGWQPYLTFGINWNIMNDSQYMANATALPELSVKPFFQYGLGIQKLFGDNVTGYAQIVLRNGGRNGIAANAGFKYMFGKETL